MSARAPLMLLLGALASLGCRGEATEQPLAGHLELCCKAANPDNVSFVGCRTAGPCRATESVWVRGPVTCTADTPDACAGGRCCRLEVDAPEPEPEPMPAEPEPMPATPEPAPAPAPIRPVPFDSQPRP